MGDAGILDPAQIPISHCFLCPITSEILEDPVCAIVRTRCNQRMVSDQSFYAKPKKLMSSFIISMALKRNYALKASISTFLEGRTEVVRQKLSQADLEMAVRMHQEDLEWKSNGIAKSEEIERLRSEIARLTDENRTVKEDLPALKQDLISWLKSAKFRMARGSEAREYWHRRMGAGVCSRVRTPQYRHGHLQVVAWAVQ